MMVKMCLLTAVMLAGLLAQPADAQSARTIVGNAAKAMGSDTLNSVWYYGSGAHFSLGQNSNPNSPWPRVNANDYARALDFTQPASRATWLTLVRPVNGGATVQGIGQQNITPAVAAWAQQLEIWVTPWGFLKGAAANNATVRAQTIDGRPYHVVTWLTPQKSPSGLPYRLVGYIDSQNLVARVQTWLEHPILGDMLVETEYTHYRDNNGLKFPAQIVQRRGGWPVFEAFIFGARANPANIKELLAAPVAPAERDGGTPAVTAPKSEKLADGVYRIVGVYNALAVEFRDHILLFEPGPQNEARAQAIIAEAKRVIPNKPIRYGVISHHHFDHTSGLPAVVAEGITIVTHESSKAFLHAALSAPRTLAPSSMVKAGRKVVIETVGDTRVFQDDTRTLEVHVIKGLPHADGLLIAYLPKERILAYADMFFLPPADDPVPSPPAIGTIVFAENLERLHLIPERIMSVHTLNPDRLATIDDILKSLGRK